MRCSPRTSACKIRTATPSPVRTRFAAGDYIHRIGRTARAQAKVEAITFVASEKESLIRGTEFALGHRLERTVNPLFPEPLRNRFVKAKRCSIIQITGISAEVSIPNI